MISNKFMETLFLSFQNSDKYALISEYGEKITYSKLLCIAADVSACLQERRMALLIMNNDVGAVVFYLACLKAGTIPVI